MKKNSRKNFNH